MTFPEKGQKAKHGTVIGIIDKVEGNAVTLKFHHRWSQPTYKVAALSELSHVCQETVFKDYRSGECGRPVKEGDLCGIHLGAQKRRDNQRAKRRAAEEAARVRRNQVAATRARMEQQIEGKGLTSHITRIDPVREEVHIKLEDLLDLLRNA